MNEINKTRHSVEKGAERASKAFGDAKSEAAETSEDMFGKGKEFLDETKEQAQDFLNEIQGRGTDAWADAKTWVKKNPGIAVGGAFIVGALVTALLSRGSED